MMGFRFGFCLLVSTCSWYEGLCDYPGVQEMDSKDFIGDNSQKGFSAAFGDVNSDKQTDVFVLSESGEKVHVFLGSQVYPSLSLHQTINLDAPATSVVPADFNRDDITDLLATFKSGEFYSVSVYWGVENNTFSNENAYKSAETFIDEPLVLDANADMIADIFVVYSNQTRGFLVGEIKQDDWDFVFKPFKVAKEEKKLNKVVVPHSHAFIDLTGDGSANLFVTSKSDDDEKLVYEIWEGSSNGLVRRKSINTGDSAYFKESNIVISPTAFADFTGNARQDIVVATCISDGDKCKDGKILIFTEHEWHVLYTVSDDWTFPNPGELPLEKNTLHIADFNLDSFPDIMMIMQDKEGVRKTVLLYNDQCTSDYCSVVGRQLGQSLEMPDSNHAVLSAFYDFSMDGTIDVIVTTKVDKKFTLKAYKNMIADDVTFLRVQVLSGLTEEPVFGVNVAGPQITYETTNTSGGLQRGCLGQLSQSAHLSLQLPYVIFGLGRLANFVDSLTVSIPVPLITDPEAPIITEVGSKSNSAKTGNTTISGVSFKPLNATWPMLIPNSQIYVIPNPQAKPNSWKNKLLVTPSQNVIMTGVVLLGTCGVLGIATIVLHWLERREDKQEKIQEAYRFHFDAM